MDIDFHYYATFAAACAAGYSRDDAITIAHAAQYVDDSSLKRLVSGAGYVASAALGYRAGYNIKAFTPVPTFHTIEELGHMESKTTWTTGDVNSLRQVWSVFHFLPANYEGGHTNIQSYTGNKTWEVNVPGLSKIWRTHYDDVAASDFKLMCLPNSTLVGEMVNDARRRSDLGRGQLHLAGIRMHVLADTWAHCYFAGTPNYWINDADKDVWDKSDDRPRFKITWKGLQGGTEKATPSSVYVVSAFYLGHGRMGQLPDNPWMKYEYTPKWSDKPITKDNYNDYLRGFSQMIAALRCIREDVEFLPEATCRVSDEIAQKIGHIIQCTLGVADPARRCQIWREQLGNLELSGIDIGVPPEYDPDLWLTEAMSNYDNANSHYYQFNLSAVAHRDFVIERVKQQTGIDFNVSSSGVVDTVKQVINVVSTVSTRFKQHVVSILNTFGLI